ncbi:kinase-like domain-containing protein, partial [Trametes polyzona]
VLHLDLKPDNVLIDSSGRAVIADYGCSVLVEPSEYTTWRGYGVSGTHTYEAPEMYSRGVFGSKAVVFSLGVVFLDI